MALKVLDLAPKRKPTKHTHRERESERAAREKKNPPRDLKFSVKNRTTVGG